MFGEKYQILTFFCFLITQKKLFIYLFWFHLIQKNLIYCNKNKFVLKLLCLNKCIVNFCRQSY